MRNDNSLFPRGVPPFPLVPTICSLAIGGSSALSLRLHLISISGTGGIVVYDRMVSKGVDRHASGLVLSGSISSMCSGRSPVCESGRHLKAIRHPIS